MLKIAPCLIFPAVSFCLPPRLRAHHLKWFLIHFRVLLFIFVLLFLASSLKRVALVNRDLFPWSVLKLLPSGLLPPSVLLPLLPPTSAELRTRYSLLLVLIDAVLA